MIDNLPKPIALYIQAENSADAQLFDPCFAEDAVVRDESQIYKGLAAIKNWKTETERKYQHTIDPLRIVEQDGKFTLANLLTGNFPNSPIELDFVFTVKNDKIVSLEILS